jgi:hypothetical protein
MTDDELVRRDLDAGRESAEFDAALDALFDHGYFGLPAFRQDPATGDCTQAELDALLYVKHWHGGALDVVIVYSSRDAFAYRVSGAHPAVPAHRASVRMLWRSNNSTSTVVAGILELPTPDFPRVLRRGSRTPQRQRRCLGSRPPRVEPLRRSGSRDRFPPSLGIQRLAGILPTTEPTKPTSTFCAACMPG